MNTAVSGPDHKNGGSERIKISSPLAARASTAQVRPAHAYFRDFSDALLPDPRTNSHQSELAIASLGSSAETFAGRVVRLLSEELEVASLDEVIPLRHDVRVALELAGSSITIRRLGIERDEQATSAYRAFNEELRGRMEKTYALSRAAVEHSFAALINEDFSQELLHKIIARVEKLSGDAPTSFLAEDYISIHRFVEESTIASRAARASWCLEILGGLAEVNLPKGPSQSKDGKEADWKQLKPEALSAHTPAEVDSLVRVWLLAHDKLVQSDIETLLALYDARHDTPSAGDPQVPLVRRVDGANGLHLHPGPFIDVYQCVSFSSAAEQAARRVLETCYEHEMAPKPSESALRQELDLATLAAVVARSLGFPRAYVEINTGAQLPSWRLFY